MTSFRATGLGKDLMASYEAAAGDRPVFAGRGIVVCAGGAQMLTNAYVLVRALRDIVGCSLPVEVWHLGAREMPALIAGLLETLGCRIVDAHAVMEKYPAQIHDGWQLKSYALLRSTFDDTILLDADLVPLIDPQSIFDWPDYRRTGAVFWPDVVALSAQNPVWDLVGLEPRSVRSWESGQIAVNKTRHWQSLWLAFEVNQRAERFYELIYGDKDTFLLAWLMSRADHALVTHPPFVDEKYLVQRDFFGAAAFQHRTNCKWSLHEQPDRPPQFLHQDACEGFLDDLRTVWNGLIFHPPQRPSGALAIERELTAQRDFTLSLGGARRIDLELLAGHQIGKGRSFPLSNWYVEPGSNGYRLVFCDYDKPSFLLQRSDDGRWCGAALSAARPAAILEPSTDRRPCPPGRPKGLADSFVDAARRGAPADLFDRDGLIGALRLLERIEPGSIDAVAQRAESLMAVDRPAATQLREILAALTTQDEPQPEPPRHKSMGAFDNAKLYTQL